MPMHPCTPAIVPANRPLPPASRASLPAASTAVGYRPPPEMLAALRHSSRSPSTSTSTSTSTTTGTTTTSTASGTTTSGTTDGTTDGSPRPLLLGPYALSGRPRAMCVASPVWLAGVAENEVRRGAWGAWGAWGAGSGKCGGARGVRGVGRGPQGWGGAGDALHLAT